MKNIGFNISNFLVVNTEGKILYSSDDIELIGLSNSDILDIIKNRVSPKGYEVKIDKIRGKFEEFYTIEIACEYTKKLLYLDTFTNLYNRNLWEWIKKNGANQREEKCTNSLIFIDIDNLKDINDTYGHSQGDKCIKMVANSIKTCIRENDLAFRFGGDEFIILLFKTKIGHAKKVIERIKKTIKNQMKENKLFISISTGVSTFISLDNLDKAFEKADKVMYLEKSRKKKCQ